MLHLDDDQRDYLYELAAKDEFRPPRRQPRLKAQPQLQRMLDDMAHTPAFVIGPRTEIVAWNAMGAALITDFEDPREAALLHKAAHHRPHDA